MVGACAQRSRFPSTLFMHQSSQGREQAAGTVPLSDNGFSKHTLVPHSPAQETATASSPMCLLTQQKPNQILIPTSCGAPWWCRGSHHGSQPQAILMTMPVTSSNPLTLVSGPGMDTWLRRLTALKRKLGDFRCCWQSSYDREER